MVARTARGRRVTPVAMAVVAALLSALLVGVIRVLAVRTRMLDIPSERSSHSRPVPRGGGAGVIAAMVLVVAAALPLGRQVAAGLAAVVLVAVVGWLDDRRSLRAVPRLTIHIVAGGLIAWATLGAPGPLGAAGAGALAWWVFWTVAMINVTNFMDGIDGLIGSQMAIFGAHLWWNTPVGSTAGALGAAMLGASAGFLAWNWAPARIFLGDVGSGALGAAAALAGAVAVAEGAGSVEVVFLPLLPAFLDASVTLVRRLSRGERVWEAHRMHLYQRLANGGWGHARTAQLYAAASLLGVLMLRTGTSYRTAGVALYVVAVIGFGIWLDRRAQPAASGAGQNAPSP